MGQGCWVGAGVVGLLLVGCQGPRPALPEAPLRSLRIEPVAATLTTGRSLAFGSIFSAPAGERVLWQVLAAGGGSIDGAGHYRAPNRPGSYGVQASLGSGAATATALATVTVVAPPDGNIQAPARVNPGATGLRASVAAVPGCCYAWRVEGGRPLDAGQLPSFSFEAGSGPLVLLACKVTNAAGDSLNSALEVPVVKPVSLTLSPASAILTVGRGLVFGFELQGGTSSEVRWQVNSPGGGTVDGSGRYAAPAVPGRFEVQVTAKDDPSKFAKAQVLVVAEPAGRIQAPAAPRAGATGLVASVPAIPGMTYAWEITGGTLLSSPAAPTVTFSAGQGPRLTLRCHLQNQAHDSLDLSKEVRIVE